MCPPDSSLSSAPHTAVKCHGYCLCFCGTWLHFLCIALALVEPSSAPGLQVATAASSCISCVPSFLLPHPFPLQMGSSDYYVCMILPPEFKPLSGSRGLRDRHGVLLSIQGLSSVAPFHLVSSLPPVACLCSPSLGDLFMSAFRQNMPGCVEPATPCAGPLPFQAGSGSSILRCSCAFTMLL